jgi:thiamine-phosphate pyrophosphorylase
VSSDASDTLACGCLVEQVRHAFDAGIDLVQVRERDLETADLADLVSDLVRLRRGTRTRIVVNDRVDVAVVCRADGVHLRADSIPADIVRRMAPPGFFVGRSVHSVSEARAAGAVDYLIAGTVFATPSKIPAAFLGVEGLTSIVKAVRVPVLAIGGMSVDLVPAVAATGAAGIAAIGLFVGSAGEGEGPCRAVSLGARVDAIRARFDTSGPRF